MFKWHANFIFHFADENIRSAIGVAFHSMAQNHQEKTKAYADTIVPLVFFAMHTTSDKTGENSKLSYLFLNLIIVFDW